MSQGLRREESQQQRGSLKLSYQQKWVCVKFCLPYVLNKICQTVFCLSEWGIHTTDPHLSCLLGQSIMVEKEILKPQTLQNSLIKMLMSKRAQLASCILSLL